MAYLIGTDIGTSGTKTVLFDEAGNTVASATAEYPLYQPANGWAEQDPADWWNAVCVTVREVIAKSGIRADAVAGIGLSGQMHGLVMLDESDRVIRRSIIWCDQRTAEECAEITSLCGADRLISITANPALTGFTASKILWVRNHEPENYARCTKIMLPKDYIRLMLTGEFATEVSDASGMQLLDVPNRRWSEYMLDRLQIDRGMLGKMYESCEITGQLTAFAAEATGLCVGTPVVGGAGDQAACAVGNGIVREGAVSATIGTSGVVFAHTALPSIDPLGRAHTFCHAVPGAWHVMGVTQGAGLSYKWMRDNFFTEETAQAKKDGLDPNAVMDRLCAEVPAGARGLIFLPYLMGERTPHLDPDARGVFFGLSAMHNKRDMLRAVMEGVVYSLCDCMEIIESLCGEPSRIYASGGGGNSAVWRAMMADGFGRPVSVNNSKEGGALGAAILAGVGTGIYDSVSEACDAIIKPVKTSEPTAEGTKIYSSCHSLYSRLYADLHGDFKVLKGLGL